MSKTKRLVIDAILLALYIISAKVSIPITTISFTLQVFVVLIIALLVPLKDNILINVVYFFMGLVLQLPVFSTGGGFQYVYSPSFGFLIGFMFGGIVTKLCYDGLSKIIKYDIVSSIIACIIGLIVIYLFGLLYGFVIYGAVRNENKTLREMIEIFILPFILFDIIKVTIAAIVSSRLKKIIK